LLVVLQGIRSAFDGLLDPLQLPDQKGEAGRDLERHQKGEGPTGRDDPVVLVFDADRT
jgi:hypothetical protein